MRRVILGVVLINALIGFVQEGRAEKALDAVRAMLATQATVLRDGERQEIDAAGAGARRRRAAGVRRPGAGRPAAARGAATCAIDEAALTGESVPVEKRRDAGGRGRRARRPRLHGVLGHLVVSGQGAGVVVATGAQTEIGRIGAHAGRGRDAGHALLTRGWTSSPASHRRSSWPLGCADLPVRRASCAACRRWTMFLAVVGLAVAAIPEGLPAMITIALAIGMQRMAARPRHRAPAAGGGDAGLGHRDLLRQDRHPDPQRDDRGAASAARAQAGGDAARATRPRAASTATARTSTPERCRRCRRLVPLRAAVQRRAAAPRRAGRLELEGDPTEGALLRWRCKAGPGPARGRGATAPRRRHSVRVRAPLHGHAAPRPRAATASPSLKGAPERVLACARHDAGGDQPLDAAPGHAAWTRPPRRPARAGAGPVRPCPPARRARPWPTSTPRFTLLGLVGLIDPPREEAIAAVAECQARRHPRDDDHRRPRRHRRGHRPRSWDCDGRARADRRRRRGAGRRGAARAAAQTDVFARASPEHKLRLVAALQAQGELRGDDRRRRQRRAGAQGAPTSAWPWAARAPRPPREAAEMVLTDDNFATIAARRARGPRRVTTTSRSRLLFILPTNGGEAGVILLAVLPAWRCR